MSIKCTEQTEAACQYDDIFRTMSYKRWLQLRKRSLTSMGWRYHL